MKDAYDIIQSVVLSEKATLLSDQRNQYVFRVARNANKIQIKQAVEQIFKKKVLEVNTANYSGKPKRERRADYGRTAHWKKAIVTLKEGEKISFV
jgi:large subunit ribosomal protein L23